MSWSYRKRRGPFTFSLSRRGPRVSVGQGCLLPLLAWSLGVALAVLLLAACAAR